VDAPGLGELLRTHVDERPLARASGHLRDDSTRLREMPKSATFTWLRALMADSPASDRDARSSVQMA